MLIEPKYYREWATFYMKCVINYSIHTDRQTDIKNICMRIILLLVYVFLLDIRQWCYIVSWTSRWLLVLHINKLKN